MRLLGGLGVTSGSSPGPWSALRHRVFFWIWLAVLVSNIGTWMRDVASGWIMAEMEGGATLVALVQAATTLPIFLLSLPAGALADIVDRRRLLIAAQIGLVCVAIALAALAYLEAMTPARLLLLVIAGGVCTAFAGPAFQAVTPSLVPVAELRSAVALNSLGVNLARAIGPALGGVIVATAGAAAAYGLDALSYLLVIGVLWWWRSPPTASRLPPEAWGPAMRTGIRYALADGDLRRILLRAAAFFFFGSAYWALLPLIARALPGGDANLYGVLLAAIGGGAVLGAFVLPRLGMSPGRLVLAGSALTAAVSLGLAVTQNGIAAFGLLFCAGLAWIAVLTSLNVAAQGVLPNWVRARGMAVYLVAFYGAMTVGAATWGLLAEVSSVQAALAWAGASGLLVAAVVARVGLPAGTRDLSPSLHWASPPTSPEAEGAEGPVMTSVTYVIDPVDEAPFLKAMEALRRERIRDGGFSWRLWRDLHSEHVFEETWLNASWLDHLRQHERVSRSAAEVQKTVNGFHRDQEAPVVRHLAIASRGSPVET